MSNRSPEGESSFKTIHELVSNHLFGLSTVEELQCLEELLSNNPQCRQVYFDYLLETEMLRSWASGHEENSPVEVDVAVIRDLLDAWEEQERRRIEEQVKEQARLQAKSNAQAAQRRNNLQRIAERRARRRPEPIVIPYSVVYAGAAALAASVIWVAFALFQSAEVAITSNEPAPEVVQPQIVATIANSLEARLISFTGNTESKSSEQVTIVPNLRLEAGLYELTSGCLQINFDVGANTVLEAPAVFELESVHRVHLERGKIACKVPKKAIGFTVQTPSAAVFDLGTEFAVETSPMDPTNIHVLKGLVALEAHPQGGAENEKPSEQMLITAGNARSVSADGREVKEIKFEHAGFVRSLDGLLATESFDSELGMDLPLKQHSGGSGFKGKWTENRQFRASSLKVVVSDGEAMSKGEGDTSCYRNLKQPSTKNSTLFFSGEFRVDGNDPVCSVWLSLFKRSVNLKPNNPFIGAVIGVTDQQFTVRAGDVGADYVKEQANFGTYIAGETKVLVGQIEFDVDGTQERVSIWVDPHSDAKGEPDSSFMADLGYSNIDAVDVRFWDIDSATRGSIDNIRVGTTWDAVNL